MIWLVYQDNRSGPMLCAKHEQGNYLDYLVIEHANVGENWVKGQPCAFFAKDVWYRGESEAKARDLYDVLLAAWRLTDGA